MEQSEFTYTSDNTLVTDVFAPLERRELFWVGVVLVLFVSLLLRLWNLGEAAFWTDEMYTEFRAVAPLTDALQSMWTAGNQGPLYYILLRPLPDHTEFWLRLPSALLGVAGVGAMIWSAMNLYGRRDLALWVGVLLAVSPFHVMLSRNARAYPLLFVLCLLASYYFLLLLRGERNRKHWLAFTGTSMLAYLTHYSAGGLGVAQLAILAIYHRKDFGLLKRWVGAQVIAVTPFLLWMLALLWNFESTYASGFISPSLTAVPVSMWNLIIGYDGVFFPYLLPGMLVVVVGLVSATYFAVRNADRNDLYWVLLVLLSLVTVVVVALYITPAYQDRYFTLLVPAMFFLLVRGLYHLPVNVRTFALAVILFTCTYNTLLLFTSGDYERTEWDTVTEYVEEANRPGDALVFEEDIEYQVFEHYFDDDPAELRQRVFLEETPNTASLEADARRIWVIYRNPIEDFHRQGAMPEFDPFEESVLLMDDWLNARRDQIIWMREFRGVTVLLLDPNANE